MNHTLKIALVACLLTISGPGFAADQYGKGLSDAVAVRVGELTLNPDAYVDQPVKVVGLVNDVCPMKGCWVEILDAQSSTTMRFKVKDDVIVFPASAKGKEIVAEGVLRRHEMSESRARSWLAHLAAEKGETFDPQSVTGPLTVYQIEGDGAEVASLPGVSG
ncbi:MAG: DUF4920 domain-containing protein [Pseudomonadales bacterium]|nr:DUF4920 domain-containing protein [Pseudomonadales bacterium]